MTVSSRCVCDVDEPGHQQRVAQLRVGVVGEWSGRARPDIRDAPVLHRHRAVLERRRADGEHPARVIADHRIRMAVGSVPAAFWYCHDAPCRVERSANRASSCPRAPGGCPRAPGGCRAATARVGVARTPWCREALSRAESARRQERRVPAMPGSRPASYPDPGRKALARAEAWTFPAGARTGRRCPGMPPASGCTESSARVPAMKNSVASMPGQPGTQAVLVRRSTLF